ncbi:hypothetical protein [Paenibacillus phocaensis]|uniref:hypothetical protein n=1 Tax=Paenibacillus phocaensis TaxID=1776378 RepID=UPI0018E24FD0|nr:hypothetical protein [Paenibacillus phocaensis]
MGPFRQRFTGRSLSFCTNRSWQSIRRNDVLLPSLRRRPARKWSWTASEDSAACLLATPTLLILLFDRASHPFTEQFKGFSFALCSWCNCTIPLPGGIAQAIIEAMPDKQPYSSHKT